MKCTQNKPRLQVEAVRLKSHRNKNPSFQAGVRELKKSFGFSRDRFSIINWIIFIIASWLKPEVYEFANPQFKNWGYYNCPFTSKQTSDFRLGLINKKS
jgi:hypothetical protein